MPNKSLLYVLTPGKVDLITLKAIYRGNVTLAIDEPSRCTVERAFNAISTITKTGAVNYGVNTGFGKLATTIIPANRLAELQRNLILSHSVGLGDMLPDNVVRLVMACKITSLARGHSGVRLALIDGLIAPFNAGVMPLIPEKGSVGASGDLAPLTHLSLMLLGEGEVRVNGEQISARQGLELAGLKPFVLGPKEGLALLNGTQVSTALALRGLFEAENSFAAGLIAGAFSLEAIKGSLKPYDKRIHQARGQSGQIAVAAAVHNLLTGSEIIESHANCSRVQDPYSIRCVPQVMGACLDNLYHAARILQIEANAASDNPLIFSEDMDIISGGNFHAEPVAFAADIIALASENKSLAHPASVDSLPTSANQEDHVSMATYAARRLGSMCFNTAAIVGIEAMAAIQGIEFHRPLRSSPLIENQFDQIRQQVPWLDKDRLLAPDIEHMRLWATGDNWPDPVTTLLPCYTLPCNS